MQQPKPFTYSNFNQQPQPDPQPQLLLITPRASGQPRRGDGGSGVVGNIRRISLRPRPFKAALAGLDMAVLLFAVGFVSPAWYGTTGLWLKCRWYTWGPLMCRYTGSEMLIGWQEAVKVLEVLALVLLLMAVVVEVYQDFLQSSPPSDNRAVEILTSLGSLFGLAGIFVFKKEATRYMDNSSSYHYFAYERSQLRWAFWLTGVGCVLGLVSALMLAISRSHYYQLMGGQAADQRPGLEETAAAVAPYTASATSQVPVCFVMVQGQAVPVFGDDMMMTSPQPGVMMSSGSVKERGEEENVDAAENDPPAYHM